jgi:predicted  nucleic acid-binding Zn-ribbon protein
MKAFLFLLVVILLAGLGYGGWLYIQQTDQLGQTRITLDSLKNELSSLQEQVVTGQANAASIQGQLLNEKVRAAGLEAELANARNQQSASASQITTLKADLESSRAKIAALESELVAVQVQISGTQSEISAQIDRLNSEVSRLNEDLAKANTNTAKANTEIASLKTLNAAQQTELAKIKDPRHFYTIEELNAWLQRDDTNTNPAFASLGLADKAFILQVRALRDGFLLPAAVDADEQYIYSWNVAIIGANIYVIAAGTDGVTMLDTVFQVPPAQRPLPLG